MKKILYIIMALSLLAGCGPIDQPETPDTPDTPDTPVVPPDPPVEDKTLSQRIPGEWHCSVPDFDADIYLNIMDDASFELYQKIGEGSYRLYRGTWTLDEATCEFNGKYNDGESWGSSYILALSDEDKSMTLTPKNSSDEKQSYSRKEIPSEVKDNCVVVVKSGNSEAPVL